MRDVRANQHGWSPEGLETTTGMWDNLGGGTAELRVDLHEDIGVVLWVSLQDLLNLHNLGNHTKSTIARLFDPEVVKRLLVLDKKD